MPWSEYKSLSDEEVAGNLIACKEGPLACELFGHWEGASGTDVQLDQEQMQGLFKDPSMQSDVTRRLQQYANQAASQCRGNEGTSCAVSIDSNWIGFTYMDNKDYIFALHSVQYRISGNVTATVGSGGGVSVTGTYQFDLMKAYNFDVDKAPIKVWGVPYSVRDFASMPSHGLARDFTVQGSTMTTMNAMGY